METIRTSADFKAFIDANRDLIKEKTVRIEDLPADDDWVNDDVWDEIYKEEHK